MYELANANAHRFIPLEVQVSGKVPSLNFFVS